MDKKQTTALKCLSELKEYAEKNNLPMRIRDELEDCQEQVSAAGVNWDTVNVVMEDLLNSIGQKTVPQSVQTEDCNSSNNNEVSAEMVKEQIETMAKRCQADNTTSVAEMTERKNTVIKKSCEQLMEISYTKAHMEELKNEDLYLQFFQNCKTKYERDVFDMFRELLQSISANYDQMLNHMKSMFQSIGGYKYGMGSEKFYYEYEEQRTGIDRKVQNEMQTTDIGCNDIISFGQTTKETVKGIVKKLVGRRKLLAWVPIFLLLGFLAAGTVGRIVANQNKIEQAEAESDADEDKEFLKDVGKEVIKSNIGKITLKSIVNGLTSVLAILSEVLILLVIGIVLLYIIYLKILKKWCNHQIEKQCGEYLKTELFRFEQTNTFSLKLDTAMENAAEEYERQYMNVLNNLFRNSQYHMEQTESTDKMSEFDILRAEWNQVKNM